jgi:malate/lactate dehydrogenase
MHASGERCVRRGHGRGVKTGFAARVQARNMTPALSAAGAICAHVRDWLLGTPKGEWVSMGVASDGSYGIPPGLFFSFPVTCHQGQWHIVQVGPALRSRGAGS